jgi:hypothetical protein
VALTDLPPRAPTVINKIINDCTVLFLRHVQWLYHFSKIYKSNTHPTFWPSKTVKRVPIIFENIWYLRWMALRNRDLRFPQPQCLRFKPSVIWCHIIWCVSPNVLDNCSIFRTLGMTCPMTEHHIPEYLTLWHWSYFNYAFLNKNQCQWKPRISTHSELHNDPAMQTVCKFGNLHSILTKSEDSTLKWNLVNNNRNNSLS